jgi:hypothetical protein
VEQGRVFELHLSASSPPLRHVQLTSNGSLVPLTAILILLFALSWVLFWRLLRMGNLEIELKGFLGVGENISDVGRVG